jgi:hypothetical protein
VTKTYSTNEVLAAFGGATTPAAQPANTGTINTGSTLLKVSRPIAGTPSKLVSSRISNLNKVASSGLINDEELDAAAEHMLVWPDYDGWRNDWQFTIAEAIVMAPDKEQELRKLFRKTNKATADFTVDKQPRYGTLDAYLDTADKLLDDTIPRTRAKLAAGKRTGAKDELIGHNRIFQVALDNGWDGYTAAARVYRAQVANSNTRSSTTVVGAGPDQGNPSQVTNYTPPIGRGLAVAPVQFDTASMYPIDWRAKGLLLCGDLAVLAGQGGSAKTAFALYVAAAGAAGRQSIGPYPINNRPGGLRILFLSAEENQNRTGLLVAAAANSLALTASERALVAQNLIVFEARANNWRIGKPRPGYREEMVPEEFDQALADLKFTLTAERIDILILDTFAQLFAVPSENDNNAVTDALNRATRAVQETKCAALILHHSPKMTRAAAAALRGEANIVRGAGAITYTPRVSLSVTSIDDDEAGLFALHGINHKRIRRIDSIRITDLPDMDPVYFQIRSERVKVHDGSEHEIRTIEFLPAFNASASGASASGASAAGGITNAARNVVMTAVKNGTRDKQGAKVPLSPGGGRDNTRDATPVIAQALQSAYPTLNKAQAKKLATEVLNDLLASGCVVKEPVSVPRYKTDNSLNGHQSRQGLTCRWELAPWAKHEGGGTGSTESSDAGATP